MDKTGYEHRIKKTFESEGKILTMKFEVYRVGDEEATLNGLVDWQDGITIFHTEHIEMHDFMNILITTFKAVEECISQLYNPNNQ
jgi:hypothetical protein